MSCSPKHVIRLRGPWQVCSLKAQDGEFVPEAPPQRMGLPVAWRAIVQRYAGQRLRLTRRLHQPTGLSADDNVLLVAASWPCDIEVSFNGERLGLVTARADLASWDITSLLRWENELQLEMAVARDAVADRSDETEYGHFHLELPAP